MQKGARGGADVDEGHLGRRARPGPRSKSRQAWQIDLSVRVNNVENTNGGNKKPLM